ncbi:MAG: lipid A export permease/ATP-binding protein MsbA [Gammaproteobacteria bacterium]|nr:lipid A export permease/ATP-binding protein MsbA [Gammaproteobacteria bacterium]
MAENNLEQTMNGKAIYMRLLGYVKPYWKAFALSLIGMVIVASTEVGFAALIKPMLDGTFVDRDPDYKILVPLALIGIFILRGIGSFSVAYCMAWVARHVIKDLRTEMFAQLLKLPTPYYDRNPSGKLIAKMLYDVEMVSEASSRAITVIVQDSLTLIGLLCWMFYLNWQLSLLFLTVGPILSLMVVYVNKRIRQISRRLQASVGDITHVAQETVEGQRVVKIFGGEEYENSRFLEANQKNRQQNMKVVVTQATSVPVVQLVAAVLLACIIYLASPGSTDGAGVNSVGAFMSFITAVLMLFAPLKRLTTVNAVLQRGIVGAESIFGLLDHESERDKGTLSLKKIQGQICYEDVSFSYDDLTYKEEKGDVLANITLEINAGETVAFVGRSGSGKTTMVSLLPRFYSVDRGCIKIDGHDIESIKLTSLRSHIALVSQDITLFNDTIAHNIAYGGMVGASLEDIKAAAKAAFALEFIEALPNGFDTMVGEKGMMLSGGQRQRLAIARAILKDSPILILDEATSALDSESEKYIQAALEMLMKNRTTLVIAHRLSTIESADKIVVMDEGKIVETGTHEALMEKQGHYAALHNIQFGEE